MELYDCTVHSVELNVLWRLEENENNLCVLATFNIYIFVDVTKLNKLQKYKPIDILYWEIIEYQKYLQMGVKWDT